MRSRCFRHRPLRAAARLLAAAAVLAAALPGAMLGDDRDLLRDSAGQPYVFILFDTSGSMNWSPKCTREQFDAGECKPLCPTGDCYTPLQADDPGSKFFLAKQALYEVLKEVDDVQFGFATYNQDGLSVRAKHWLYQAAGNGVDVPGWGPFPAAGASDVFGRLWNCDTGTEDDHEIGCYGALPADLGDAWELGRVQRLSKGGLGFNQTVGFFIRHAGTTYRVRYEPVAGSYGADLQVRVELRRCDNGSCSSTSAVAGSPPTVVTFRALGDFLSWDNAGRDPNRANPQLSYFTQAIAADPDADNTCAGWDPNTDTAADRVSNYGLRFPTDTSDSRGPLFDLGDVIPLDWRSSHREDILRRLAPNTALDPAATPDFRIAPYLADERSGAETFLRLKNENARPLFAEGSTPLANSIRAFRTWYAGCPQGACPKDSGWSAVASQERLWNCRRKYLLVITDGDETCSGPDVCEATGSLFSQEAIKTFVVAFGVQNTPGNRLSCMAANGGSGEPLFPQNKQELVQALRDTLGQIREETSAFASAAVPSVQAEVADRIYLSSFTPLNAASVWDGHLDAYLKPLPLTADRRPDRDRRCGGAVNSSCRLWDAGEELLAQAPAAADLSAAAALDENVLRLGPAEDERRVFYGKAGFGGLVPRQLRLFSPPGGDPATDAEWRDLWSGLNLPLPATPAEVAATRERTETIIARTLAAKTATVERRGLPDLDITYVLGDIFHADPVLIDQPNEFLFFSVNLYGNPAATSCSDADDPGYRCHALRHRRRRKMLVVASNDGQLHFFDAGTFSRPAFSNGTGRELFSYMPRLGLPIVREQAEGSRQIFSLDATPRVDDVFLDPEHNGTPTARDRRWRTVVIGGFREGGKVNGGGLLADFVGGYYALDVTQPDRLDANGEPTGALVVPSCLSTRNQTVTGCGPLPFPALLWEFTDSITTSRLDEDENGFPDLGQTWSVPTVGRIRVIEDGQPADKWVAIFGGGMDAESKPSPKRGTWLYMVDVETGRAIYKQPLVGAAPGDPAVLDSDLDGYLDTVYVGTTAGFLYKVDISSPGLLAPVVLPRQRALPALAANATLDRITDRAWEPFPIFDTTGCPLYFAPTAFYVTRLNRFALGFGCGDREDLWNFTGREGRFYVIVDNRFSAAQVAAGDLPRSESDYQQIDVGDSERPAGVDFVLDRGGWFLRLDPDERVITQAFGLSGILIFSSFQPETTVVGQDPSPNPAGGGRQPGDTVCARGGDSRIFLVYANNANSVMTISNQAIRYRTVPEFVTNPYVEQGATKNPSDGSTPRNSEQLDDLQKAILQALKERAPEQCKFGNYWLSVSAIRSDVGHERYATIPICLIERNWKEH